MGNKAEGIPDRSRYGNTGDIPLRQLLTYVDQLHKAERAGEHHDIRLGDKELYSWATRKGMPNPGEKRTLFQQPLHSPEYADFQGEIPEGYGKGTVKTHDRGSAFVTEASPDKIKFVLAHRKNPEYYTMIRTKGKGKPWLIVNHTPQDPEKVVGDRQMFKKKHLGIVPAEHVEEVMDGIVEGKIDGASGLFKLKDSSIDVMSFRVGKGNRPIMHTERFFGERENKFKIPKEFRDRVARGEIYGVDKRGKPIGAQATSPLLNMSLENSLKAQKERGVNLRAALFGFADKPLNYPERENELKKLLKHLPSDKFGRPPVAHNKVDAMKLWKEIESGKHPETDEGIVAYPKEGNPVKVKLRPDQDVRITDVFPGEGKYKGSAGGIVYEGGGRVGTGFDDAFRQWMWDNRDALKGRIARITSTKQLPSGKHYQPSFVSLHEDYPTKEASEKLGGVPTGLLHNFLKSFGKVQIPLFHGVSDNVESLLKGRKIFSAAEAHARGLLKSVESDVGSSRYPINSPLAILPTLSQNGASYSIPKLLFEAAKKRAVEQTPQSIKSQFNPFAAATGASGSSGKHFQAVAASSLNPGTSKNWNTISFTQGRPSGYGEFGIMTTPSRIRQYGGLHSIYDPEFGGEVQANAKWIFDRDRLPYQIRLPNAEGKIYYTPTPENADMVRQLIAAHGRHNVIPYNRKIKALINKYTQKARLIPKSNTEEAKVLVKHKDLKNNSDLNIGIKGRRQQVAKWKQDILDQYLLHEDYPTKKASTVITHNIHGDEEAGEYAAKKLEGGDIERVDAGNHTGKRRFGGKDLNRHFGTNDSTKQNDKILNKVLSKKPTMLVDLHEDSEASGAYAYTTPELKERVKAILKNMHQKMPIAKSVSGDETDKGVITDGKYPGKGALVTAAKEQGVPYVLLETPSKKAPINSRINYQEEFVRKLKSKS